MLVLIMIIRFITGISLYDDDRKTFLYDIKEYDKVLIITDAIETESKGTKTLINALAEKSKHIVVFRWC